MIPLLLRIKVCFEMVLLKSCIKSVAVFIRSFVCHVLFLWKSSHLISLSPTLILVLRLHLTHVMDPKIRQCAKPCIKMFSAIKYCIIEEVVGICHPTSNFGWIFLDINRWQKVEFVRVVRNEFYSSKIVTLPIQEVRCIFWGRSPQIFHSTHRSYATPGSTMKCFIIGIG